MYNKDICNLCSQPNFELELEIRWNETAPA